MHLGDLVDQASVSPALTGADVDGDRSVDVRSVAFDSRRVSPGALYCCVPGLVVDGHDFAGEAISAGAPPLECGGTRWVVWPGGLVVSGPGALCPPPPGGAGPPAPGRVRGGLPGTHRNNTPPAPPG